MSRPVTRPSVNQTRPPATPTHATPTDPLGSMVTQTLSKDPGCQLHIDQLETVSGILLLLIYLTKTVTLCCMF